MGLFFGGKLKEQRELKGLSGYKLAQRSGLPSSLITGIELGKRPPSDSNLEAIAAVDELGVTLQDLRDWRDLDKIGGPEALERLRRHVLPGFQADSIAGGSELGNLRVEVTRFRRDLEAFTRRLPGNVSSEEAHSLFVDAFGSSYSEPAIQLIDAAAGRPSVYWRSAEEARTYLEAIDLGAGALRNLLAAYPDLQGASGVGLDAKGFSAIGKSLAAVQGATDLVESLVSQGAPNDDVMRAVAGLRAAIEQHAETIDWTRARNERLDADMLASLRSFMAPSDIPSRYDLAKLSKFADDAGYPLTDDEAAIIRDLEADGMFWPHPALESALRLSPENRAWIFDSLREAYQDAMENMSPFRKQVYEHRAKEAANQSVEG